MKYNTLTYYISNIYYVGRNTQGSNLMKINK